MYKILIVDDDEALRFVYRKMTVWAEQGFEIAKESSNGRDALEILKQDTFDVVITDIRMPIVDGIEMLRKMREKGIMTYTILLSSYNEFEYARQAMILGASDFVVKPVKKEELAEALNRARRYLDSSGEKEQMLEQIKNIFLEKGIDYQNNSFFREICEYVLEHMKENVTMEMVAEHMGYNKDYFGKTCQQKTGYTFKKLMNGMKMEYAKMLLKKTSDKTYEISEKLGYAAPDYFTKVFKEETGMTPSMYRNL